MAGYLGLELRGRNPSVMNNDAPIGVFDSGIGGLTVAREIMRQIPNERIVYFGDTMRLPYGSKSKDNIILCSRQIISFLQSQGVKAVVIACNTASALALEEMKSEFDMPIIGVVKPGAKMAAETTVNGRIGLVATESTIKSGVYEDYIKGYRPDVTVYGKACPLLVPLVEEGMIHDTITYEMVHRYVADLMDENIDTLIMGCTHYPLLRSTFRQILGESVHLVNPAYETACELKRLLSQENIANIKEVDEPSIMYRFYVSDAAEKFKTIAKSILPFDIGMIQKINVDEL